MKKFHAALSLCLASVLLLGCAVAATADNCAPVAQNMEICTYRGVAVSGRLAATDPEGESLSFEITTPPIKGEISLGEDGSFTYTPAQGKKGKDYFGYKAVDTDGNSSHEATVIIRIQKQNSKISYSDMENNGAHYGAVRLAEEEIFIGECLGGRYIFHPEETVSRGEFLAMCMKLADSELLTGVQRTGFADDSDIAQWLRPYVSTALLSGAISGESTDSGAVFAPGRPISGAEAAVMLDHVLGLQNVSHMNQDGSVPVWAEQSVMNLSSSRILTYGEAASESLTRAEAAEILLRAMDK
ncbi:MAG: Ig-like domain-containing protein [Candidatus Heteroscillospira sp.]|jgi:hypothetical protein